MMTSQAAHQSASESARPPSLKEVAQGAVRTLALTQRLEGALVAQLDLARLHDQGEARVDALLRLFLWMNSTSRPKR